MRHLVLALLGALLLPFAASAQMRIDVSGVGATQYPIAIARFATDGRVPQDVSEVVRGDLQRSGAFRIIEQAAAMSDTAQIDFVDMRRRGADAVLTGSVARLADGRYDIRYRLSDAVRQTTLGGESLVVAEADLRYGAHRIADWVYEKLTGEKGIFSTRIAFVSKQGSRYKLSIADWDGENVVTPLNSPEPIISPSWSRDGSRLAYVSFESKKPVVYVHTLATGQRKAVANFKGSNSAPAWSPDGRTLAVALTIDGLSQIYLIPSDGSAPPKRLTTSTSIDTEPVFTPDGSALYFTSDRGGSPQIYRMPVSGGDASRVTFSATYNVSPRISPDGRSLAYVSRRDGKFLVVVRDLASGAERVLSEGGREESPSFAPNGRWIMYATQAGGRDSLVAASVDGRVRQRLTSNAGDIREPTWGPFSN
ncbi:Tol-Pal system beta propeller repeat protein TolB [Burkholderiaceae bacterium FT117]|uniref:Tol-Pal system beta propeller repeat protein TolB n=1 Tax=Zeimonas sediminis TaxID=2944268 RepID=UPI002342E274|nr:Tol-Pal system beta propeller repeat protein TolB [Zeimonas sediminis]MCM5570314.1 Tol-Pal system beta propeller repeat protein TolB [Zeimonas sediminis]